MNVKSERLTLFIMLLIWLPILVYAEKSEVVEDNDFTGPQYFVYPNDGVVIGQGWDSFIETGTEGHCVQVIEVPIETSSFETTFEEIKSTFSLYKQTSVSAKMSGGYGAFGGSASASSNRATSLETDYLNILFQFIANNGSSKAIGVDGVGSILNVINDDPIKNLKELTSQEKEKIINAILLEPRKRMGSEIKFSKKAKKLLDNNETTKFKNMCGDGFVSSIHRGSHVRVIATFESSNVKDHAAIKASLKAHGFGVKASGSYSSKVDKNKVNEKKSYKIMQEGGIPFGPPTEFSELTGMINKPEKFLQNPTSFKITVTPYTTLVDYPSNLYTKNTPNNLQQMANYYIILTDIYNLVSDILLYALDSELESPYEQNMLNAYGGVKHFQKLKDNIHYDLQVIERTITKCYNNESQCNENVANKLLKDDEVEIIAYLDKTMEEKNTTIQIITKQMEDKSITKDTILKQFDYFGTKDVNKLLETYNTQVHELQTIKNNAKENITGILKDITHEKVNDTFFQKFYSYLIEIPLPKSVYSLTVQKDDDKKIKDANNILKNKILINRLIPWKDYFCRETMSDYLCVYDSYLFDLIDKASLEIQDELVHLIPYKPKTTPKKPIYYNHEREIFRESQQLK